MAYSSIIRKKCKCGKCDNYPDIGFQGYSRFCKPEMLQEKIKKHNQKQSQISSIRKLGRGQDKELQTKVVAQTGLSYLMNDLDDVFSKYIRLKYADSEGVVKCFTCSNKIFWKHIQNGHYTSRANMATRYEEDNCRPQCGFCNSKHETDTAPFKNALEAERKGITEYLDEQARLTFKFTQSDLKELLIHYREKLKFVQSKLISKTINT
jgi:hypothetical protein